MLRSCAGEPELAVAIHCLQRPIVVYRQVRCLASAKSSASLRGLHCTAAAAVWQVRNTKSQCGHKSLSIHTGSALGVQLSCCLQVRTTLLGEKTLEKVSVYGAEDYPGKCPVCVLFSGAHYDTLLQVSAR